MFSKDLDFWEIFEDFTFKDFLAVLGGVTLTAIVGTLLFAWGWNTRGKVIEANKAKPRKAKDPIDVMPEEVSSSPVPSPVSSVETVSSALAVTEPVKAKIEPFQCSDDCRSVKFNGEALPMLTPDQALTLKNCLNLKENGFDEFHQKDLLRDVGTADKKRLRDTFKSNLKAFHSLFCPVEKRKGIFRLNFS